MITPEDRIRDYWWETLKALANAEVRVAALESELAALKAQPVVKAAP